MGDKGKNKKNLDVFKHKSILIASIGIVLIIISGIIIYIHSVKDAVKAWEDKIYPGVSIHGVNLDGLTKEEAVDNLNDKLLALILDKKLDVLVEDKKIELLYKEINPTFNAEALAEEAINYGKDKGLFAKNSLIKNKSITNLQVKIEYDEESLKTFVEKVKAEVNSEPKDATVEINGGNIVVTPEVNGKKINEEDLHNKLVENINGDSTDIAELKFELEEKIATVKADILNKITGKISSYSSSYKDTGDGRVTNLQIATQTVNGTVLMPGDEFSYNDLIGDTTPDKGYKKANTYVGNKIVPDYGGGICQVSTTLYNAAMRANLRSTERVNHSLTVSYADPGLDATVANDIIDYKFKNSYDFPIYIQGYAGGGIVSFNIYGNVEGMGGRTYDFVSQIEETYSPEVKYEDDPTIEVGIEKVESYGMPGYKASSYIITYENGVEVNREHVSTDVYLTTDTITKKGTKKKEEPKKSEEKVQINTSSHKLN